ncbi:MAG: hypothetical protein JXA21_00740 [Anaerolineae bacterium]|nr:hypothetical protein [Anaerolineae bacterium]
MAVPESSQESVPYKTPASLETLPVQGNSSHEGSQLTQLFPDAQSPRTSGFISLMGGVLLTLGIVILFLVGQRRAK